MAWLLFYGHKSSRAFSNFLFFDLHISYSMIAASSGLIASNARKNMQSDMLKGISFLSNANSHWVSYVAHSVAL